MFSLFSLLQWFGRSTALQFTHWKPFLCFFLLIQLLTIPSMATHTAASSLVFVALTPARILLPISTLLWKKGVLILSETMRKTCERKVYFSGTLESNRSLQICNHRSLEKLRFFKVLLDWISKDCWVYRRDQVDSFAHLLPCWSLSCTEPDGYTCWSLWEAWKRSQG